MKSILLPLTAQSHDQNVQNVAMDIAVSFNATLTGLYVAPDPRTTIPFMGEGLTAEMIQDLCTAATAENDKQAVETLTGFKEGLKKGGIELTEEPARLPDKSQARWAMCSGLITDHVGRRARTADLAVCAQPTMDSADSQEVFHDLIYRSGRPVLMVPGSCNEGKMDHILIAWNGRAEGARAIGAALPLLHRASKVTLLQIGEPLDDRPGIEHAADYLRDHGLSATILNPQPANGSIGEQIMNIAANEQVDMIVIGAYSHSRWREMILGGVTRHLVNHCDLPVFMSH